MIPTYMPDTILDNWGKHVWIALLNSFSSFVCLGQFLPYLSVRVTRKGRKVRNLPLIAPLPQSVPRARKKPGTDTSEVALVAEGGGKDPLSDHTAAVGAHQLALRIVRVFHELSGAAVRAPASARHLNTRPAPQKTRPPTCAPPTVTVQRKELGGAFLRAAPFLLVSVTAG